MSDLKKTLSLYGLTMVAIGSCIGSGIFLTPSIIADYLPNSLLIILVWALGGIITLTGALSLAELGSMYPKAGGVYVYLREAYGDFMGFLYGWSYLTVINTGALAALSIAFASYFSFIIPLSQTGITLVAVSTIIIVTIVNIFRVKIAEMFSNVFTGLKLAGIALIIIIGMFMGNPGSIEWKASISTGENDSVIVLIGLALVSVVWSFGGWQHASFLSGEAKNARKNIPRAMIIGALIVTLVYLAINIAYMSLLNLDEIVGTGSVAADAISKVLPYGGLLIAIIIAISVFGTAGIYTLTAPRIYFAMARDGIFWKKIARVHPRYKTPVNAILLQSVWAIVILLLWGTFEDVITYVVFTDWIFFTLAAVAVIVLRKKKKQMFRPYKTILYPVTPLIFIIISAFIVVNTFIQKPAQAWAGLILIGIGYPVFRYFKKSSNKSRINPDDKNQITNI
ncbi:APC family permease [Bacteroidota bacterium]